MVKSCLFIGRFQPFHLGHLDAIKQILKKHRRVIIGIGSAQESFTRKNPFTARERFRMIKAAFEEAGIPKKRYAIIEIPDIKNDSQWVSHVKSLTPPFDEVFTGSPIVKKLFRKAGYKVCKQKFNLKISGTFVRSVMLKNGDFQSLVPKSVAKLLSRERDG